MFTYIPLYYFFIKNSEILEKYINEIIKPSSNKPISNITVSKAVCTVGPKNIESKTVTTTPAVNTGRAHLAKKSKPIFAIKSS